MHLLVKKYKHDIQVDMNSLVVRPLYSCIGHKAPNDTTLKTELLKTLRISLYPSCLISLLCNHQQTQERRTTSRFTKEKQLTNAVNNPYGQTSQINSFIWPTCIFSLILKDNNTMCLLRMVRGIRAWSSVTWVSFCAEENINLLLFFLWSIIL